MTDGIKVSVVVPIYGTEKYIARCAASLFSQSYENMEFVFVNDCTKDNAIGVLKDVIVQFPRRKEQVKIIEHQANKGSAGARNTGIDNATGDYMWQVDSDDYIVPDAVSKLVEFIGDTMYDIVVFGNYTVYPNYTDASIGYPFYDKEDYLKKLLIKRVPSSMWTKLIRRDFFVSSCVRFTEGVNHGEDYSVMPRLIEQAKNVAYLPLPLYYYECSNTGSYMNNIKPTSIDSMKRADDIIYDYFRTCASKEAYVDTLPLIHVRSYLGFVKHSLSREVQKHLNVAYADVIDRQANLKLYDKLLLYAARRDSQFLLRPMLWAWHWLKKDRNFYSGKK